MKKKYTLLMMFFAISFVECGNKPTNKPIQQQFYRQRWTQDYLEKSQFAGIKSSEDGRKYIPFNSKVYWGQNDTKETLDISFLKKIIKENYLKLALFGKDTSMTPIYFVALKMAASNGGTSYQSVYGLNHFNISYEFMKKNMINDSLLMRYEIKKSPEGSNFYVFDSETEAKIIMGYIYHGIKPKKHSEGEAILNGAYCQIGIENFPKRFEFYLKIAKEVWREFEDDYTDEEEIPTPIYSYSKPKEEVKKTPAVAVVKPKKVAKPKKATKKNNHSSMFEEGVAYAQKYADGLHGRIPPSVFLTLWTQETSQGRRGGGIQYFNYFNIKCPKHKKIAKACKNRLIDTNGCCINIVDDSKYDFFRIYDNMAESFEALSVFLRVNPRYRKAFRCDNGEDFLKVIANAGYATDQKYQEHILNVMEENNFQKYDKEESFFDKLLVKK